MSQRLEQLKRNVREARDHAYLGRYEESHKSFKKSLDIIEEELIMNSVDRKYVEDWKRLEATVLEEKRLVDSVLGMLNGLSLDNRDKFNDSWGDFEDSRNTKYKFSGDDRRNNSNMKQTKYTKGDPDVWGPPPPLTEFPKPNNTIRNHSIQKRGPVAPQRTMSNNGPNTTNANKEYDKPWLGNNKKPVKKAIGEEGKKSFLLDRYPDGNGPDAHLIQMLQKEVIDTNLNTTFEDIAELETAKSLLQEAVLLPLKMPQYFTGIRRAWKGVLMFGPPGTGKTLLAKAIASSGKTTFFNVSASSLASKWKGESEKLVRILFQMARFYAPTTLFFDEIDALGGRRSDNEDESTRKVKTELLVQMDGATGGQEGDKKYVMVLAATNRPWDLDEALRRRLEKRIYIPLPNEKGRLELLKINLKDLKVGEDVNMDDIVRKTKGFSGADITNVCREAAYMPMRKKLKEGGGFNNIDNMADFEKEVSVPLTMDDFREALKNVNKSVGEEDLVKYEKWMKEFGSA